MAKLILPSQDARMVRYGGDWGIRRWHFLSKNSKGEYMKERATCGAMCINPVYSTLAEVLSKDLCTRCWSFEAEK